MTEKDFISNWTKQISETGVKNFPQDFDSIKNYDELTLHGKALVIGQEFFGSFEILNIDGTLVYQAQNHLSAKFIVYSNRLKPTKIIIPKDNKIMRDLVTKYENYIDSLIRQIELDYKKNFSDTKNSSTVINNIFRNLNLIRY